MSKKTLDITEVSGQLEDAVAAFARSGARKPEPIEKEPTTLPGIKKLGKPRGQQASRPASQSASQPPSQSTDQLTKESFDTSPILGKPKAFYITQRQDEDLDWAVEKLAKGISQRTSQKIDRSTVVRLVFEEAGLTSDSTITRLASRLVNRLISQLTG